MTFIGPPVDGSQRTYPGICGTVDPHQAVPSLPTCMLHAVAFFLLLLTKTDESTLLFQRAGNWTRPQKPLSNRSAIAKCDTCRGRRNFRQPPVLSLTLVRYRKVWWRPGPVLVPFHQNVCRATLTAVGIELIVTAAPQLEDPPHTETRTSSGSFIGPLPRFIIVSKALAVCRNAIHFLITVELPLSSVWTYCFPLFTPGILPWSRPNSSIWATQPSGWLTTLAQATRKTRPLRS
jgi:hypothetical protein